MKKKERLFRFKQFNVRHSRSAMKVGVDGVLLGAWTSCAGERVLDVGCGCGLISLMIAQRFPQAIVEAIDIDHPSVEEAVENVSDSLWADRISVKEVDFTSFANDNENGNRFGLIISNPPFFDSGVADPSTPREKARHQGNLSPFVLIEKAPGLLKEGGVLSLIAPADMSDKLTEAGEKAGLSLRRICFVRNSEATPWKRIMIEFILQRDSKDRREIKREDLTMFVDPETPTPQYQALGSPFYLKF